MSKPIAFLCFLYLVATGSPDRSVTIQSRGQEEDKTSAAFPGAPARADDTIHRHDRQSQSFRRSQTPSGGQEVWQWHPNRAQAVLVTKLHSRFQHLAPRRSSKKRFDRTIAFQGRLDPACVVPEQQSTWTHWVVARDLYIKVLSFISREGCTT